MSANVKIYTREWCGFCTSALRLLDKKGIKYEHIDASGNRDIRAYIAQESGQSTVPQIFINGKSIGGYSDLKALDDRGELDKMIQDEPTAPAK